MSWRLQQDEKAIGRHPVVNHSRQESRTEQKECPTERICRDQQLGWFEVSRLKIQYSVKEHMLSVKMTHQKPLELGTVNL
jgi:hypothetical protein